MVRWFLNKFPQKKVFRMFELIPGLMVWSTLLAAILISIFKPLWAIYIIIIFDLYWLLRVTYLLIYLSTSWRLYRTALLVDWRAKLEAYPTWPEFNHLIFLPTYKESYEVVRNSFISLDKINYPHDKMYLVLAGEERDKEHFAEIAAKIQNEFGNKFAKLLITIHPANIIGEMASKGANINWAGHRAQELVDGLSLDYSKILVSTFDIDTCPHPQYFAHLTYTFLTTPDPLHCSYQPVATYNNNIWESPAITRIVANSTTFWLLTDIARPERLFTFSSHSMPWQALIDVGFWQNDIVTEDSRIFLQCFVRYDGNYRVTPLYLPVSMDTVFAGSLWRSLVNQYKQQRRWAYGVENFPYMAYHFWREKKIPFAKKVRYIWNQLEGIYSLDIAPLLIFILGRLPLLTADMTVKSNMLAHNAPVALSYLMSLAMIGLIFSAILSTILLPPKPENRHWSIYISMVAQWLLFPFSMIIFGAIPATDATTRLMLGKYLGFWVTEKKREGVK